jgi:starch phosphorylase
MDGANIEIRNTIGEDNMFIFGVLAEQVEEKRTAVREGRCVWSKSFKETLKLVEDGMWREGRGRGRGEWREGRGR